MRSKSIRFSVVIPLYNKGPHVERAIRSVLDQDLPAAEIIVVDDASTDEGPRIVRRFKAVKILRRSERGPGGYAARNLGVEEASSEWIAFLDADDSWRPNHLSTLAAAINGNDEQVGCAFTRPTFVTAGSTRPYPVSGRLLTCGKPLDLPEFLAAWLDAKTCPMWTGAVAIRRSVLLKAGMFPAGAATRGGDKDLWLRVMALTKGIFVPEVTAEFHQETVNRVTASLDYSVQPVICRSIVFLREWARPATRRLLRRLNNMEVVYYARYAAGAGAPFNPDSLRSLSGRAVGSTAAIISYAMAGYVLRLLRSITTTQAAPRPQMPMGPPVLAGASKYDLADRCAPTDRRKGVGRSRQWVSVAASQMPQEADVELPMRLSA